MEIGFTGHRDRLTDEAAIIEIHTRYPDAVWIHGGAPGFDSQVDNLALRLGKKRWQTLIVLRPEYRRYHARVAPLRRNEVIVDRCSLLVACYDGRETGGTRYTVEYAKKKNKPIEYVNPKD